MPRDHKWDISSSRAMEDRDISSSSSSRAMVDLDIPRRVMEDIRRKGVTMIREMVVAVALWVLSSPAWRAAVVWTLAYYFKAWLEDYSCGGFAEHGQVGDAAAKQRLRKERAQWEWSGEKGTMREGVLVPGLWETLVYIGLAGPVTGREGGNWKWALDH